MEFIILKISLLSFIALTSLLLLSSNNQVGSNATPRTDYQQDTIEQYMNSKYIQFSTTTSTSSDELCEKLLEMDCETDTNDTSEILQEKDANTSGGFGEKYLEQAPPVLGNANTISPTIKSSIAKNNVTEKVGIPMQNITRSLNQTVDRGFLTYENSTLGIKIQYPSEWNLMKVNNLPYSTNIFVSPLENNTDRYRENAFIKINDVSSNMTLNDYTSIITKAVQNRSDFRIVDFSTVTLSDNPGYRLIGLTRGNQNINVLDEWTIKDGRVYRIAFYLEEGKSKTYLPIAQRMIDSFEITK